MIRRPPRTTQSRSSAASDVYKRQPIPSSLVRTPSPSLSAFIVGHMTSPRALSRERSGRGTRPERSRDRARGEVMCPTMKADKDGDGVLTNEEGMGCLLYTSDAADDLLCVVLGGRRII